jgi:hypothetical protein
MNRKKAMRLTFFYQDNVVQLASQAEADMTLPSADPLSKKPSHGFWVELRDTSGNTLYRRMMHNPMPTDREVFSNEPGQNLGRVPGGPSEGSFSIVVPNHPDATEISLFSSHHEAAPKPARPPKDISPQSHFEAVRPAKNPSGPAQGIGRFNLKKP